MYVMICALVKLSFDQVLGPNIALSRVFIVLLIDGIFVLAFLAPALLHLRLDFFLHILLLQFVDQVFSNLALHYSLQLVDLDVLL